MLFLIALATFVATFLGGIFALRFKDKLHLILGFSAGAVVGVAFFDLLPEAVELGGKYYGTNVIMSLMALGFIIYMLLDRFVFPHFHGEDGCANTLHRGKLGAGSLSIHSLFDGMAVGFAFQVSAVVGATVTAAVLAHNFSDGMNTVSLIIKNGGSRNGAFKWLIADAVAPAIGIIFTLFITVPENFLGLILSIFGGSFLYLGASDLLPESHHNHPTHWTTVMTVLGMAVLYLVIRVAGL